MDRVSQGFLEEQNWWREHILRRVLYWIGLSAMGSVVQPWHVRSSEPCIFTAHWARFNLLSGPESCRVSRELLVFCSHWKTGEVDVDVNEGNGGIYRTGVFANGKQRQACKATRVSPGPRLPLEGVPIAVQGLLPSDNLSWQCPQRPPRRCVSTDSRAHEADYQELP